MPPLILLFGILPPSQPAPKTCHSFGAEALTSGSSQWKSPQLFCPDSPESLFCGLLGFKLRKPEWLQWFWE
jgi:hypothetical protein